ncbi:MAG: hypothetical protein IT200_14865 [Thermoleophilia bacterium]|nr:hypothetical protein [Thermoleophilia bacterium]
MRDLSRIIDEPPRGTRAKAQAWLRGRRFTAAAVLALAEIVYMLVARPGTLAMAALAFVLLVLSVMGITRLGPGLVRDALMVVAIAQALVLVMPFAIGLGFAVGVISAVALLALLVLAAFRLRI